MRKILTILLLITAFSSSYAQFGWYQQNSNTSIDLHGVSFYSKDFGFAIGLDGAIRKTTNGGVNWNLMSVGVSLDFHKIAHLDSLRWIIAGQNGLILYSSDAGSSWAVKPSGVTLGLGGLDFIEQNGVISDTGYCTVAEGKLLKTTNGGNSWTMTQLNTSNNLYFVKFINANIGYVGGKSIVFKTTNGGLNWSNISPSATNEMSRCDFRDENNGIIIGGINYSSGGVIYRTTNGGANWSTFNTPFGALKSVHYLPNGNISVAGNGAILMSYDDGISWTIQSGAVNGFFHDSYLINNQIGYIVGNSGTILKTTSGGVITNISTISNQTPSSFSLHQNYPNPFNPSTKIKFEIPELGFVNLTIYNSLGQEIQSLVNDNLSPGVYEYSFDGSALSGGIFYYKLSTENFSEVRKMVLVK